jgi:MoxR-like ATPase
MAGAAHGEVDGHAPRALVGAVVDAVSSVLHTDRDLVELAVACLTAGGHLLIEDLPGLGKTTLAKSLARALGLDFRRVQCTADLLPADLTGYTVLSGTGADPVFHPGPLFTNVLMADELNRASTRAQSALLEAMEERQVSVDGTTYALPAPFLVIATQNPHDAAGTSPLPHGQRDRFLMCLSLGYPGRAHEDAMLAGTNPAIRAASLPAAVPPGSLERVAAAADAVHVAPALRSYVLDLIEASRHHPSITVGASPRAALALLNAARAIAVARGSDYVAPGDVQRVAGAVLAHRLVLAPGAELGGATARGLVDELLATVPVPVARRADLPAGIG